MRLKLLKIAIVYEQHMTILEFLKKLSVFTVSMPQSSLLDLKRLRHTRAVLPKRDFVIIGLTLHMLSQLNFLLTID